jgi:23S rRNA pseudouridine1911/1915/1917 synthase
MEPAQLIVLYEDNHLLAVAKPAGLLVQADRTGDPTVLDQAKTYLKHKYQKPGNVYLGLVHRLDRPVSGVLLLARTSKAASRLSEQFRGGQVVKTYLAVVTGQPSPAEGELIAFLSARGDANGRTQASKQPFAGAKEARLTYHVQNCAAGQALLEIQPHTGRRHQIRVQLALAGHPIVGDVKYGAQQALRDRSIGLHALRLEVKHPVGGTELVLTAPLPAAWPWPPSAKKQDTR